MSETYCHCQSGQNAAERLKGWRSVCKPLLPSNFQRRVPGCIQAQGRKVDTPLLYPSYLNTQPFLASSILQKRYAVRRMGPSHHTQKHTHKQHVPPSGPGSQATSYVNAVYELYAVVVHKGHLQVTAQLCSLLHCPTRQACIFVSVYCSIAPSYARSSWQMS